MKDNVFALIVSRSTQKGQLINQIIIVSKNDNVIYFKKKKGQLINHIVIVNKKDNVVYFKKK